MAAATTAKQILYHPPLALLAKRRDSTPTPNTNTNTTSTSTNNLHNMTTTPRGAPALTVTIPFSFSRRLSRVDARRDTVHSAASSSSPSIRRASRSRPPRPAPHPSTPTPTPTPRTSSLPRLGAGVSHQGGRPLPAYVTTPRSRVVTQGRQTPSGGRPSLKTSRTHTTTPCLASEVRRTSSGFGAEEEEASSEEIGFHDREAEERDGLRQRQVLKPDHHQDDDEEEDEDEGYEAGEWGEGEGERELSPEEERERRVNEDKCRRWLQGLPDRFSSMHVVQHVVHNGGTST